MSFDINMQFKVETGDLKTVATQLDNVANALKRVNSVQNQSSASRKADAAAALLESKLALSNEKAAQERAKSNKLQSHALGVQTSAQNELNNSLKTSTELLQKQIDVINSLSKGFTNAQSNVSGLAAQLDNVADAIKRVNSAQNQSAQTQLNNSLKVTVDLLQKYNDSLDHVSRGLGKTKNTVLSLSDANVKTQEYISNLGTILNLQKQLQSSNPFDNSVSGLTLLNTKLKELKEGLDNVATSIKKVNSAQNQSSAFRKDEAAAAILEAKLKKINVEIETKILQLDKEKAKALASQSKSQNQLNNSVSTTTDLLQKQTDVLNFMTEGFSKGQSTVLALAKANGQTEEYIGNLGEILKLQRQLQGGDPFDKSIGGLTSLNNKLRELTEANKQYDAQTGLTRAQTRELARDFEGLTIKMVQQNKSIEEIDAALKNHAQEYIRVAGQVNSLTEKEKNHERQQRDLANAIRFVAKEEERMIFLTEQLSEETNAGLNFTRKAAEEEARYARALKLSGISIEEQTNKLATYRQQQQLLAKEGEKRQVNYLQRGLQPQIGDVVVSLASGQNPLTVLLQQGDQIRGLITQTGVQGEALNKAMRDAFSGTITSIKETGAAMLSLAGGAVKSLGSSFLQLGADINPLNKMLERMRNGLVVSGGLVGESSDRLRAFDFLFRTAIPAGIGITIAGLAAFGVALTAAFFAASREQDNLNKALILNGGSLGIVGSSAVQFAQSFESVGISTSKAAQILTVFAKEGGFAKQEIEKILPVAKELESNFDISIEQTVKSFAKLKEKPVEALYDLAKSTGLVSLETVRLVEEQTKLGNSSEASSLAIQEATRVNMLQVETMKREYSLLGTVFKSVGEAFSKFWNDTKSLIYKPTAFERLKADISDLESLIKDKEEGVTIDLFGRLNLEKFRLKVMKEQLSNLENQSKKQEELKINTTKAADASQDLFKYDTQNLKGLEKYTQEVIKVRKQMLDAQAAGPNPKATEAGLRQIARLQEEYNKSLTKTATTLKTANFSPVSDNSLQTTKTLFDKQIQETENLYKNTIEIFDKMKNAKLISEEVYAQEVSRLTKQSEEEQFALYSSFSDKYKNLYSDRIGKLVEARDKALAENKNPSNKPKIFEDFTAAVNNLTNSYNVNAEAADILFKKLVRNGQVRDLSTSIGADGNLVKNYEKISESLEKYNQQLDYELANLELEAQLIGKSQSEKTKYLDKLKYEKEYLEQIFKIRDQLLKQQISPEKAIEGFNNAAIALQKGYTIVDKKSSVEAGQEVFKELESLSKSLADAIATALTEGGKAGGKKLLDIIKNLLAQPLKVQIEAYLNGNINGSGIGGIEGYGVAKGGSSGNGFLGDIMNGGTAQSLTSIYNGFNSVANAISKAGFPVLANSLTNSAKTIAPALNDFGGTAISFLTTFNGKNWGEAAGAALGSTLGSALGPLGSALGSTVGKAIGKAVDKAFGGGGGPKTSMFFGPDIVGPSDQVAGGGEAKNIAESIQSTYKQIAESLNLTAKELSVSVGFSVDTAGDALTQLQVIAKQAGQELYNRVNRTGTSENVARGQEALDAALKEEVNRVLLAAIMNSDLEQKYKDFIAGATDVTAAVAAVQQLKALDEAVKKLGDTFDEFKSVTNESSAELIKLFGGVDNLTNALSTYYENFFSETEKFDAKVKSVSDTFASLGLTMPDITKGSDEARLAFRALLEQQNLSTESGRTAYAALLQIAGVFAEITPATEAATTELEKVPESVKAIQDQFEELSKRNTSLTEELFALQNAGNTQAIREREISLTAEANREILNRNYAIEDEIARLQQANTLKERQSTLEDEIFRATATVEQIRAKELAALDASLRPLQERIYAIEDEKTAIEEAKRLAEELANQRKQVEQSTYDYNIRLLQAQGKETEVLAMQRQKEIDAANALDSSLGDLLRQIFAAEDAAKAAAEATAAATQAEQALADKRKQIADTTADYTIRLLQAQGKETEVLALQRQKELLAADALDSSLGTLLRQIFAAEDSAKAAATAQQELEKAQADAKAAADQAAQAEQALADKRKQIADTSYDLEIRLLQAQGNEVAALALQRQKEINSMNELDPALSEMLRQIYAAEDASKAAAAAQQALEASQQAAEQAAQAAAQAEQDLANKRQQIADSTYDLNLRLLQAQGKEAEALLMQRQKEYDGYVALDSSLGDLILQIYAAEDANKANELAQQNANAAAEAQKAALEQAQKAQEDYNNSIQEASKFLSEVADNISQYFASLRSSSNYFTPQEQTLAARRNFENQLQLARGGNREALSNITQNADQYIQAFTGTATSSDQVRTLIADLEIALRDLPSLVSPEELIVNAINQTGAQTVQSINASAAQTVGSIVTGSVNTANAVQSTNSTAQVIVDRINALNQALKVELTVTATSKIEKLIEYVADTDKLPEDLKELALTEYLPNLTRQVALIEAANVSNEIKVLALKANDSLIRTLEIAVGSSVSPEVKDLALKTNDDLVRTLSVILGTSNATAIAIASSISGTITKTIQAALGTSDNTALLIATAASSAFTRTVNLIQGNTSQDTIELALKTNDSLSRTLNLIAGVLDPTAKALALKESDRIQRLVEAALGSNNATALELALKQADVLVRTVQANLGSSNAEALRIALQQNDILTRTVQAVSGNSSPVATQILNATNDSVTKTVVAALGSGSPEALQLALKANEFITKTVTGALGSTDPRALELALKESETITKVVNAYLNNSNITPDQQAILDILSGNSTGTITLNSALQIVSDSNFTEALSQSIAGSIGGLFTKLDTSVNGLLNRTELEAALGPLASNENIARVLEILDLNGDGQISKLEALRQAAVQGNNLTVEQNLLLESQLQLTNSIVSLTAAIRNLSGDQLFYTQSLSTSNGVIRDYTIESGNRDNVIRDYTIESFLKIKEGNQITDFVGQKVSQANSSVIDVFRSTDASARILQGAAAGQYAFTTFDKSAGPSTNTQYPNPQLYYAQGGVFTNKIVDEYTRFNPAVMGEAGPEAIVPLAKMPNGDLGIRQISAENQPLIMLPPRDNSVQAENASLKAEINQMRQEMKSALFAIAKNTGRTAEQLNRWDDGDRLSVGIMQDTGEAIIVAP